ncbi:Molecular chaperone IbpA, HSP20 family [Lentzea waywayandensis]|uniref:Molecular chaperone IbpA, HSP20 family n=1 Tax=Lentzea waywayandensis TaxID=84724 RepID=A0A1I6D9L4_9PSEU|nr:Hsp20/alpha crystallin family protein [Lentzea waywayandensis]SFR02114.1 Molecular chaperone IbpA, HSP20 family [Lentzea waywayandensis]
MSSLVRHPASSLLPDLWEMFDATWPFGTRHPLHIEDFVEEGTYVLRVELPGLDAAKDIDVSAADGSLTITAQREETKKEQHRSEFRYGSFSRTVSLPAGTDTSKISAEYKRGILEVRVPTAAPPEEHKVKIDVQQD